MLGLFFSIDAFNACHEHIIIEIESFGICNLIVNGLFHTYECSIFIENGKNYFQLSHEQGGEDMGHIAEHRDAPIYQVADD